MSVTSGFFNSKNGDRKYDAVQMSSIFDGIVVDGVLMHFGGRLMVTATGEDMTIRVDTGRAWFNHTWTLNDSILPLAVPQSELILDRIDAVVIDVNGDLETRANDIVIVKGTPATEPQRPTLIDTQSRKQIPLAYIHVRQTVTSIRQADITNMVGTSACPFCTAPLEKMSIDALVAQWGDQWNEFYEQETAAVREARNFWNSEMNLFYNEARTEFSDWKIARNEEFNLWFGTIKDILADDVAGNLAMQIVEIRDEIAKLGEDQTELLEALRQELIAGGLTVKEATHAVNADNANTANYAASAGSVHWDNVQGKPAAYPPTWHSQDANTIGGTFPFGILVERGNPQQWSLRPIQLGTWDHAPGVTALDTGWIYGMYQ